MVTALLLAAAVTNADAAPRGFVLDEIAAGGETLRYALYLPRDYTPARRWPLLLALHGRGESGRDGLRQLAQGVAQAIIAAPGDWPVVAVLPQKSDENREWEEIEPALLELVAAVRSRYAVDPDRLYLTGLSQGGHGAWVLGARHPDLWAAVVPVCGYTAARARDAQGRPPAGAFNGTAADLAPALARLPVWAFHGAADSIVPVAETERMVAAIRAAGGAPRSTIFPGVDHGSWDPAYRDPALPAWLLQQHRARTAPQEVPQ